jgi:hypothetical protein
LAGRNFPRQRRENDGCSAALISLRAVSINCDNETPCARAYCLARGIKSVSIVTVSFVFTYTLLIRIIVYSIRIPLSVSKEQHAGEVALIDHVTQASAANVAADHGDCFQTWQVPTLGTGYVGFNVAKGRLQDKRLRRAARGGSYRFDLDGWYSRQVLSTSTSPAVRASTHGSCGQPSA